MTNTVFLRAFKSIIFQKTVYKYRKKILNSVLTGLIEDFSPNESEPSFQSESYWFRTNWNRIILNESEVGTILIKIDPNSD